MLSKTISGSNRSTRKGPSVSRRVFFGLCYPFLRVWCLSSSLSLFYLTLEIRRSTRNITISTYRVNTDTSLQTIFSWFVSPVTSTSSFLIMGPRRPSRRTSGSNGSSSPSTLSLPTRTSSFRPTPSVVRSPTEPNVSRYRTTTEPSTPSHQVS